MKPKFIIIILTGLIFIGCIFVIIFRGNIKDTLKLKNLSSTYVFKDYNYKENSNLSSGSIKVQFTIVSGNNLQKIIIDNNGIGYVSIFDLFCGGGKTLNEKIIESIQNVSSNFFNLAYFDDSRYCLPIGQNDNAKPVITISEFILNFGTGTSYVNPLNLISTDNLGDPWGAPIYFELGGEKLETPYIKSNQILQNSVFHSFEPTLVKINGTSYPIIFNNIKILGSGQGNTNIRGSCIFIVYNLIKTSQSYGDGWFSKSSFQHFSPRRLEIQGFFWSGHFGIVTDYPDFGSGQFAKNIQNNNIQIGVDPQSKPMYIPAYNTINDNLPGDLSNYSISQNVGPVGAVEILIINIWVELQENSVGGATLPYTSLGVPLLTISNISLQRIYMSGVTVMSYADFNKEAKSLVYIYSGFLPVNSQFPGDIFLQQCAFSSRNTNVKSGEGTTDAISLAIDNGDKVSIVNSTFHGQQVLECNKLAMFNCYCLHVGNPSLPTDQKFTISNPAVIFKESSNENSSKKTGFGDLQTSSRIIFQNLIFVIHLNGKEFAKEFDGVCKSQSQPQLPPRTLSDCNKCGLFKVRGDYDYFSKKTIYPFFIQPNNSDNIIQNIFMQNCVYYGIIVGDDNVGCPYSKNSNKLTKCPFSSPAPAPPAPAPAPPAPAPPPPAPPPPAPAFGETTFSAINLNNIENVFINNFSASEQTNGNNI